MSERLPRTSRPIAAIETSGDLIEVQLILLLSPGKDALEIHFIAGELTGLKLVGFTIWERRDGNGRRVTFPGRPLIVHGDKRNFELLRAIGSPTVLDRVRELVLSAYEQQSAEAQHIVSQ